jgi:ADP-heptose:LPS heptosyltransferase
LVKTNFMAGMMEKLLIKAKETSFTVPGALSDESRILAVGSGDLCDLLFHIPLLKTIRARYPRTRTDFLVPESNASLVVPSGLARECFIYDESNLRVWSPSYYSLLKRVRAENYDLCLIMAQDSDRRLESISLASGARLRIGPSHAKAYPAINLEVRPHKRSSAYRGQRLGTLAPFLGLPSFSSDHTWPLPEEKLRRVQQLIHFNKPRQDELLLGVDPALGKTGTGISLQNLHFIINQISSQRPCRVIPLTLGDDRSRVNEFTSALNAAPMTLENETKFDTLLQASLCDLFLSGNTDLFHYAVAQNVPTLGLFLEEDSEHWIPEQSPNLQILRVKTGQRLDIDILMQAVDAVRSGR